MKFFKDPFPMQNYYLFSSHVFCLHVQYEGPPLIASAARREVDGIAGRGGDASKGRRMAPPPATEAWDLCMEAGFTG